jgi:hypothetical protein
MSCKAVDYPGEASQLIGSLPPPIIAALITLIGAAIIVPLVKKLYFDVQNRLRVEIRIWNANNSELVKRHWETLSSLMTHFGKLYGRKVIWQFLSFFTPAMIQPWFVHDTVHRRGESSNSAVGVRALIRPANLAAQCLF